jgi:hypothetical protein
MHVQGPQQKKLLGDKGVQRDRFIFVNTIDVDGLALKHGKVLAR